MSRYECNTMKSGKTQCDLCRNMKNGECTHFKVIPRKVRENAERCRKIEVWG